MVQAVLKHGAAVGACGACVEARGIQDGELVTGTRRSSLDEWAEWTLWAGRALVF